MQFVKDVQHVIQMQVLGTADSPSQWKLPLEKMKGQPEALGNITGSNTFAHALLIGIDAIIEAFIPADNNDLHGKLIQATTSYTAAMELLTLHQPLSDEEIKKFQVLADYFFETWTSVFGQEGATNYIHFWGLGHMREFLITHRCLYLFSQQGWEALNNKVQAYFHLCTQRGGKNSGCDANSKSYIFPIVRFIM